MGRNPPRVPQGAPDHERLVRFDQRLICHLRRRINLMWVPVETSATISIPGKMEPESGFDPDQSLRSGF